MSSTTTDLADRFVQTTNQADAVVTLAELERRYILRVIGLVEGNKSRAAQLLGLDRRTLYRKLDRYRQGEDGGMEAGESELGTAEPVLDTEHHHHS